MEIGHKVATQHRLIESLLKELARAVSDGDGARSRSRLASLRRALEAHFALEEDHYFPALREARPDLDADLRALEEQHGQLRADLDRIAAGVDEPTLEPVRSALGAFDACFRRHEETEGKVLTR